MLSYPAYLIMHPLLLGLARRPTGIKLPGAKIFVQDVEIGIALQHSWIDWRKHLSVDIVFFF